MAITIGPSSEIIGHHYRAVIGNHSDVVRTPGLVELGDILSLRRIEPAGKVTTERLDVPVVLLDRDRDGAGVDCVLRLCRHSHALETRIMPLAGCGDTGR